MKRTKIFVLFFTWKKLFIIIISEELKKIMNNLILDYKEIFWIISVALTFLWYYFYIKDIYFWKNRPHFFSWFIWWIITLFIYLIQISWNSWAGSWMVLFTTIITLIIAVISIFKWTKDITISDWISLLLWIIAISIWFFITWKIFSLVLLVLIDIFWYYPTFRKSFKNPFEENYMLYLLSIPKFWLAILALNEINLITSLYLFANFIILIFLVILIILRRKQLSKNYILINKSIF
jgi:hypothetical protein